MTLPTSTSINGTDDDSDMFGPPRSSPPIGYHHHRSRVPMISPKLRLREERKRILQLCAHKLERIKDSETNLRRSVCINNTYSRLTDELRREKHSRYLANLPKSETKPETAHDNIFSPFNSCSIDTSNHSPSLSAIKQQQQQQQHQQISSNRPSCSLDDNESSLEINNCISTGTPTIITCSGSSSQHHHNHQLNHHQQHQHHQEQHHQSHHNHQNNSSLSSDYCNHQQQHQQNHHHPLSPISTSTSSPLSSSQRKRTLSSNNVDTDLEILDRELNEINASMPLIDPEITQGAEQLEKAISSRKRSRSEDESDRLVREALSQFYIPPQRLISAIDDCPLDSKRQKLHVNSSSSNTNISSSSIINSNNNANGSINNNLHHLHHHHHHHHHNLHQHLQHHLHHHHHLTGDLEIDLGLDMNEVIMDALRLGSPSPTPSVGSDSCGQAAMMSESGVFHNLVVTSLET